MWQEIIGHRLGFNKRGRFHEEFSSHHYHCINGCHVLVLRTSGNLLWFWDDANLRCTCLGFNAPIAGNTANCQYYNQNMWSGNHSFFSVSNLVPLVNATAARIANYGFFSQRYYRSQPVPYHSGQTAGYQVDVDGRSSRYWWLLFQCSCRDFHTAGCSRSDSGSIYWARYHGTAEVVCDGPTDS